MVDPNNDDKKEGSTPRLPNDSIRRHIGILIQATTTNPHTVAMGKNS